MSRFLFSRGKPRAAVGSFPYPGHRTMAEIIAAEDRLAKAREAKVRQFGMQEAAE